MSVSDESIRVVALAETDGGLTPLAAASEPTPPGAVRHGSIANPEAVSAAIGRLLGEPGLAGDSVRLAVDGEDVIVRILELPVTGARELQTSVLSEIEDFGLFGSDEAAVGMRVVEQFEREGVKNTRVLVSAAQRQLARAYQDALARAGAGLLALEPAMLTSLRATGVTDATDDSPRLIVRLTGHLTEMAIVAGGRLLFSHGFAPADAVSAAEGPEEDFLALGESWESLTSTPSGVPSLEPTGADDRVSGEDARLQEVIGEAVRSLAFFERRFSDFGPIRSVAILADADRAVPARDALQARLPVPVELADPLRLLHLPAGPAPEIAALVQDAGAYAAALGSALGGVPAYAEQFGADLIPRAERREVPRGVIWVSVGLLGAAVLLVAGLTTSTGLRLVRTGRELAAVQQQADDIKKQLPDGERGLAVLKKAVDDAEKAVADAGQTGTPTEWSKTLDAATAALPPGVSLTRLAIQSTKDATVEGTAPSQDAVSEFARKLMAAGCFRQAVVASVDRVSDRSQNVKFILSCKS